MIEFILKFTNPGTTISVYRFNGDDQQIDLLVSINKAENSVF